jgi:hypothetical protein
MFSGMFSGVVGVGGVLGVGVEFSELDFDFRLQVPPCLIAAFLWRSTCFYGGCRGCSVQWFYYILF